MTRHSKVFVPVSVDKRLPDKPDVYLTNRGHLSYELSGIWHDGDDNRNPNYWLEEKENVYVLTEQELIKLMSEFMYQLRIGTYEMYSANNGAARAFLQSKTNPQTENK